MPDPQRRLATNFRSAAALRRRPQQNDAITSYACLLRCHRLVGRKFHGVRLDAAHANEPTCCLVRFLCRIPIIDMNPANARSG